MIIPTVLSRGIDYLGSWSSIVVVVVVVADAVLMEVIPLRVFSVLFLPLLPCKLEDVGQVRTCESRAGWKFDTFVCVRQSKLKFGILCGNARGL